MAHLDLDLVADRVTVHDAGSSSIQYPSPKNGVGEEREVNGPMALRHCGTEQEIRYVE